MAIEQLFQNRNVKGAIERYSLEIIRKCKRNLEMCPEVGATCTRSDPILAKIGENRMKSALKQEINC